MDRAVELQMSLMWQNQIRLKAQDMLQRHKGIKGTSMS